METLEKSLIDRQNILNNSPAIWYIKEYLGIALPIIDWEMRMTIKQVAEYFDVDERTIKRYLDSHGEELRKNGYEVFTGKRLSEAKINLVNDINVPELDPRAPSLATFTFRAFLNIWMLLTESVKAKELRNILLNVVIDFMNQKWWWTTKYINQNDESFAITYKDNISYRKKFTDALNLYVDAGKNKYPYFTNLIYETIFLENTQEYRLALSLSAKDNVRHTFYEEILALISGFENWFAEELSKDSSNKVNWKYSFLDAKELFDKFKTNPIVVPLIDSARTKMASRDKWFRDIIHEKLEPYMKSLSKEEYQKFCMEYSEIIWQKNREFIGIIDQNKEVLLRLKDR